MKFIFFVSYIIFGETEKVGTRNSPAIPKELLGKTSDCARGHDQAGVVQKFLVLSDFPAPRKMPITCKWHISTRYGIGLYK